jgi:hypothetical protein
MTCCVIPVPRKGHDCQGPGKENFARGAPKGQMLKRRQQTHLECNKGTKDQDIKLQLHLGSEGEFNKTVRQTFGLEGVK